MVYFAHTRDISLAITTDYDAVFNNSTNLEQSIIGSTSICQEGTASLSDGTVFFNHIGLNML